MAVNARQWNAFLATLIQNADPDQLDPDLLQRSIIGDPKVAGENFTRFLQNGCRLNIGGLKVAPQPFDPATFPVLGEGWRVLTEEHDVRNDGLVEVDFARVGLTTGLNEGETAITGEVKLARLKQSGCLRYGANVFMGLWRDYQALKENSLLECLYRERKTVYLDFFGDVLQHPDGGRYVLYLCRGGVGWDWDASRLDGGWGSSRVSAVSQVAS
ncbi:MAG: hypothetical protein AAB455_03540 [Patescibacteria group bacterium]